ncbi:hypothetical protein [Xanthocytophaga flava]|uniref:hypothetical protein n=1 Tax=Xanthocytophaga flava TaxID=3048013 RepID=UPI0028D6D0A0|nr:hypothetical protein [Xanthocytophaga flavus]MDJ1468178.1 hypothetical protein [Xanthocytophaga flavus]
MIYLFLYLIGGFVYVLVNLKKIFQNSFYAAPKKHQTIYVAFFSMLVIGVLWFGLLIVSIAGRVKELYEHQSK